MFNFFWWKWYNPSTFDLEKWLLLKFICFCFTDSDHTDYIALYVSEDKTEYMCFNQRGDISTLNGSSLKLVDKFTYLGSSVSSTETDINTRLAKAWKTIDRLSIMWKSDLIDKIKSNFFKRRPSRYCYMDALHGR